MLRKAIEGTEKKLAENLQLNDIFNGAVDVPDVVLHFFNFLVTSTDKRRWNNPAKGRRVEALRADVIFATTAGQKKPAKHFKFGLPIKKI